MYSLYIDTHSIVLNIAIFKNDKLIVNDKLESALHSSYAINCIQNTLKHCKITIDDINEIIVITGPGSFTGVRIGVVIAKIIGFAKNITIKPISYLEALSLSYDRNVLVGIKEKNGVFVGSFNKNHELVEDYFYLTNTEFENYKENIFFPERVDFDLLIKHIKSINGINPHLLKPLYVKKIEVLK